MFLLSFLGSFYPYFCGYYMLQVLVVFDSPFQAEQKVSFFFKSGISHDHMLPLPSQIALSICLRLVLLLHVQLYRSCMILVQLLIHDTKQYLTYLENIYCLRRLYILLCQIHQFFRLYYTYQQLYEDSYLYNHIDICQGFTAFRLILC